MNNKESALAVLMEPVEVRHVFPHWPDGMNLAICLLDSGECRMFIYRCEEADSFPTRMRRYLKLPVEDICIFPARAGYPSRKLLYSDEQRLLALVADAPELVEEAIDYSSNYLFALEEGLDPTAFLSRPTEAIQGGSGPRIAEAAVTKPTRKPTAKAAVQPQPATKPTPKPTVKVAVQPKPTTRPNESSLPAFLRKADVAQPGSQFRSAIEISASEEPAGAYRLLAEQNGWIIVERPGVRGGDVRVSDPGSISLSDDRRVVAVRLMPIWPTVGSLPVRILIRATNLPHSLIAILAKSIGEVQLESDGNFLFLHLTTAQPIVLPTPTAELDPISQAPEPVAVKTPKRKRRLGANFRRQLWLVGGGASLLFLIGVGLRFGAPPQVPSDEPNASIDWNRYRIAGQPDQSG
ncbi:MAG: hypothetical protein COC12_12800 [Rhodobacteraceae bacterium]|nr:MAG: hypothetical protein COC12_12800 [Paracoccaceae bacterium]